MWNTSKKGKISKREETTTTTKRDRFEKGETPRRLSDISNGKQNDKEKGGVSHPKEKTGRALRPILGGRGN